MFELGKNDEGISFCKLEHAFELDKLKIGEFTYFRKYLGMADYNSNFQSWLKRPSVVLVLALSDNKVVGWSMNEKWSSPSKDGRPVYVLRGIEISPKLARKGLGRNMFYFISNILIGHIITKPVNKNARLFFESMNFVEPSYTSPVDLGNYPGYLILEEDMKESISCKDVSNCEENITSCKLKLFPKEMISEATKSNISATKDEIEETHAKDPLPAVPDEDTTSKESIVFDGRFIGEQKMMSPCKCGNYVVNKYKVTGKRKGTAFICNDCHLERYFLPIKKRS